MGDLSYLTTEEEAAKAARAAEAAAAADARTAMEKAEAEARAHEEAQGAIRLAQTTSREELRAKNEHPSELESRIRSAHGMEAPLSEGAQLNLEDIRAIGAAMRAQGKLSLSNEEMEATTSALRGVEDTIKRTTLHSYDGAAVTDGSGQPVKTGTADAERSESLTSLAAVATISKMTIGENTELTQLKEELTHKIHTLSADVDDKRFPGGARQLTETEIARLARTEHIDDDAKEKLKRDAITAASSVSDKGDMIAAARLLDRVEHNASPQEIAQALLELEAAKRSEDITIRLRNGKTISVVNDGENTEVTVNQSDTSSQEQQQPPLASIFPLSRAGHRYPRHNGENPVEKLILAGLVIKEMENLSSSELQYPMPSPGNKPPSSPALPSHA